MTPDWIMTSRGGVFYPLAPSIYGRNGGNHCGRVWIMSFIDALEMEAREQLTVLKETRVANSVTPDSARRTKLAIGVIGAYVRLRATLANERTNELVARRLDASEPTKLLNT